MYTRRVPLIICMAFIVACTSFPSPTEALSRTWEVSSIPKKGLLVDTSIRILFEKNHVVTGFAGCNTFRGLYGQTVNRVTFENITTTKKACRSSILKQESAFLQSLAKAIFLQQNNDGLLLILDSESRQILSLTAEHLYSAICRNGKAIKFQLTDPEHLSLTIENNTYLLTRITSASGAKYSNDTITFWNKGENGIIKINSNRQQCQIR